MADDITPDILLRAYALGIFPMADGRDAVDVHWIDPRMRGVLPLESFHMSRSLRKALLRGDHCVRIDTAFEQTVRACANRPETWINKPIFKLYQDLHAKGFAHSIEVWSQGRLIGGLYGVTLGAAFFGESMFSLRRDASKIALAWTVHRLRSGGFSLFDTQFLTPHLASLGGVEISRATYQARLADALEQQATFFPQGYAPYPSLISSSGASGASGDTSTSGALNPESQDKTQMS